MYLVKLIAKTHKTNLHQVWYSSGKSLEMDSTSPGWARYSGSTMLSFFIFYSHFSQQFVPPLSLSLSLPRTIFRKVDLHTDSTKPDLLIRENWSTLWGVLSSRWCWFHQGGGGLVARVVISSRGWWFRRGGADFVVGVVVSIYAVGGRGEIWWTFVVLGFVGENCCGFCG